VIRARTAVAGLAGVLLAPAAGCGDESTFALGRELEVCEENLPTACGISARCVLDTDHYLEGTFPNARRFIARAAGGTTMHFQVLLTDQYAPGTELQLTVHEPNCAESHVYDSAGQDLFRVAGSDGVILIPMLVSRPGDHLVEVVSDAYCSYALKWDP
jgi:hypothetical protein